MTDDRSNANAPRTVSLADEVVALMRARHAAWTAQQASPPA
jgi:hypothetical protein